MYVAKEARPDPIRGDLVWWRETGDWHTLVTIHGDVESTNGMVRGSLPEVELELILHDVRGRVRARHPARLARGQHFFLDSRRPPGALAGAGVREGVLAIQVSSPPDAFERLYPMVDWFSDSGELICLHSDQSMIPGVGPLELTEIVAETARGHRTALVFLNGPERQPPGVLDLTIRNHRGRVQRATHGKAISPFALARIELSRLFPGLASFGEGRAISVSGRCATRGLFLRPYVVSRGAVPGGYHGGNRYRWTGLPALIHARLGRGEVNPVVALHGPDLTTGLHVFLSHDTLPGTFGVDARLHDQDGHLVAERPRWLSARRRGLARGDLAELLPPGTRTFTGHLALTFTTDPARTHYPRHLQALVEYRTPRSVARVMTWSDIWNARAEVRALVEKLGPFASMLGPLGIHPMPAGPIQVRCHYRALWRPPLITEVAISNCGTTADYADAAPYRLRLENARGDVLETHGCLAPFGTLHRTMDELFPEVAGHLAPGGLGLLTLESPCDLAAIHLTRNLRSGAVGAEHFMHQTTYTGDQRFFPAGS